MIKVHEQVLVICKKDIKLEDVMYWFQEIDLKLGERMADERCEFILSVKEEDIPLFIGKVKKYLEDKISYYCELLGYRATHSLKEVEDKYGSFRYYMFDLYKSYVDNLNVFNEVRNLDFDNPKFINFMKSMSYDIDDKVTDVYIKNVGYGSFNNPYSLWDFYHLINEFRLAQDTYFLVDDNGNTSNIMMLDDLNVIATVRNIDIYTQNWLHIIFCKDNPKDSDFYTMDEYKPFDKACKVDDIKEKLKEIKYNFQNEDYKVMAVDFHY